MIGSNELKRSRLTLFYQMVRTAKSRKLHDVTITASDVNIAWKKQKGRCALTGLRMNFTAKVNGTDLLRPSLDRIDSRGGYTPNNICLVCTRVNIMKGNLTESQFIWMCRQVVGNVGREKLRIQRRDDRRESRKKNQNLANCSSTVIM